MRSILNLLLVLGLSGCSLAPKYKAPKLDIPDDQCAGNPFLEYIACHHWWTIFCDPKLDELERQALENNHDMVLAVKNIEEAANALHIANADFFPSAAVTASENKLYLSTEGTRAVPEANRDLRAYCVNFGLSYELDIFGKNTDKSRASMNRLLAVKKNRDSVFLALTSSVAKTYFSLLSVNAQLRIAQRTLKTRQSTYDMFLHRYNNGVCKELDLRRVEAEKLSVQSKVLALESAKSVIQTSLALLTGLSPKQIIEANIDCTKIHQVKIVDNVLSCVPSTTLLKRPDIIAAEYELKAANADIGVARAAFFPSISLTTSVGSESNNLTSLFNSATDVWSFGGSIALPIFNGGKMIANEKIARIRFEKALENYKKTVRTAFKEAWDAIVINNKNRLILESVRKRAHAIKRSYTLAQAQENEGLIGLIDLLDVERNLLAVQMEHVQAIENALTSAVDLCRAIGSGINERK